MACALCETRKEKRFCPAVHGRICALCCGTEREATLDCPSACPYLQQARRQERPRDWSELEPAAGFTQVTVSEDAPYRLESLISGLAYAIFAAAGRDRGLRDRDIIAILAALAKSYETLVNSNLMYEEANANPAQQAISAEFRKVVAEHRERERKQLGYTALRDADVLQAVVVVLRLALARSSGRRYARGFLDFAASWFPEKDSVLAGPQEPVSRLIVP